jgi:hypothetical protein
MVTLDANKVYIIITYGQSNSLGIANVGDATDPILNPATTSKNYKVEWDWTNSVFTLSENRQVVKSINDNSWNRVSPSYYGVEGLDKRLAAASLPNPILVNISAGIGAIELASLTFGTGYYNKLLSAIQFVKNQFPTKTIEVLYVSFIHGESDSYYVSRANLYQAGVIALKNQLNIDAAAITGQTRRFGFYINQISWSIPGQAEGLPPQIMIKDIQRKFTDPEIVFCLPTYQLATATQDPSHSASDIHFSGYSLLAIAETMTDIFFKREILGVPAVILTDLFTQRISSNQIVVKLTQNAELTVDQSVITLNNQKGFEFKDAGGVDKKIIDISAAGNDIVLTLEGDFTTGTLYYCYTYPFFVNSVKYMRQAGSIRTTTGIPSSFYNATHYSYLPAFSQAIIK